MCRNSKFKYYSRSGSGPIESIGRAQARRGNLMSKFPLEARFQWSILESWRRDPAAKGKLPRSRILEYRKIRKIPSADRIPQRRSRRLREGYKTKKGPSICVRIINWYYYKIPPESIPCPCSDIDSILDLIHRLYIYH